MLVSRDSKLPLHVAAAFLFAAISPVHSAGLAPRNLVPAGTSTPSAFSAQDAAIERRERVPRITAHGFLQEHGRLTTVDVPGASALTVIFGIDDDRRTAGGYVDARGRLRGFVQNRSGDFIKVDFPRAAATFVARINVRGQIVGAYSYERNTPALQLPHGFLLDKGVFTKIDVPGAVRTQPFGINRRGQIVGEYVDDAGRSHGFLLDEGAFTTIDAPGGRSTMATDIGDDGRVVGFAFDNIGDPTATAQGFLRKPNGTFSEIQAPDAAQTLPFNINNRGVIGGIFASAAGAAGGFVLDGTAFTSVEVPAARSPGSSYVLDINDDGIVAGVYDITRHGFSRDRRGNFTAIDFPNSIYTEAAATNNRGQIVGRYNDSRSINHGFLFDGDSFTTIDAPGAVQSFAQQINDRGQVVGTYVDAAGALHGFLRDERGNFTAVDVPAASATTATGLDNRGRIVGAYQDAAGALHGFLRAPDGTFTTMDVPGATATLLVGINDRGQIIGSHVDADGMTHGLFRDERGAFKTIDAPNALQTLPHGINNRGDIVGTYLDSRRHGFLLRGESFTTVDAPGAFLESLVEDIDDRGRLVGTTF
jgi:uncharacterized membrane protein